MIEEDELIEKVKSYPKCDDSCRYYHHMVDVSDPDYKIAFCDFEMEAIMKGTHCIYYRRKE